MNSEPKKTTSKQKTKRLPSPLLLSFFVHTIIIAGCLFTYAFFPQASADQIGLLNHEFQELTFFQDSFHLPKQQVDMVSEKPNVEPEIDDPIEIVEQEQLEPPKLNLMLMDQDVRPKTVELSDDFRSLKIPSLKKPVEKQLDQQLEPEQQQIDAVIPKSGAQSDKGSYTEAVVIERPEPDYPKRAFRKNWEGKGVLEIKILASGLIDEVNIVESSGYQVLDAAMIETVANEWRFLPAEEDGTPVASTVVKSFRFEIKN